MSHFYSAPDPCVSVIVICVLLAILAAGLSAIVIVLAVLYIRELNKPKCETNKVEVKVCRALLPIFVKAH